MRVNHNKRNGLPKVIIPWGGGKSEGKDQRKSKEPSVAMDTSSCGISGVQCNRNVEVKGQSTVDMDHRNGQHLKMAQKKERKNDVIIIDDDDSDDDGADVDGSSVDDAVDDDTDDGNATLVKVFQEPSAKRSPSLVDQAGASSVAVRPTKRNKCSKSKFKSDNEASIKEVKPLLEVTSRSYEEMNNSKRMCPTEMLQKPKVKQTSQIYDRSSVSKKDSPNVCVDSHVRETLSGCQGKIASVSLSKNPKGSREQEKLRSKVKRKVLKEETGEDVIDLHDVHDTKKESNCSTGLKIRSSEHSSISMKLPREDSSEMTNVIKSLKGKRKLDRYPPGDLSKRTKYPPSELSVGE